MRAPPPRWGEGARLATAAYAFTFESRPSLAPIAFDDASLPCEAGYGFLGPGSPVGRQTSGLDGRVHFLVEAPVRRLRAFGAAPAVRANLACYARIVHPRRPALIRRLTLMAPAPLGAAGAPDAAPVELPPLMLAPDPDWARAVVLDNRTELPVRVQLEPRAADDSRAPFLLAPGLRTVVRDLPAVEDPLLHLQVFSSGALVYEDRLTRAHLAERGFQLTVPDEQYWTALAEAWQRVQAEPQAPEGWAARAHLHQLAGMPVAARRDHLRAVALSEGAAWGERLLRTARAARAAGWPDLASADLRRLLAAQPDAADAALELADVLRARFAPGRARGVLDAALARHPDDPRLWDALADVLELLGQAEESEAAAARALRLRLAGER